MVGRRRTRCLRATGLTCLIVVAVGVAGCRQSRDMDQSPAGEPPIGQLLSITDMDTFALPLDPYQPSSRTLQASVKAEEKLLSRCLRRFGFDTPPQISPSEPSSSDNAQLYGITDEQWAESRGYHGPAPNAGEQPQTDPYPPAIYAVITGEGQRSYGGQLVPARCTWPMSRGYLSSAQQHWR